MALSDVVKNISVDVSRVAPTPTVFAKQNENGKRQVIVKLMKDGQPFTIGTGVGGYIQGATAPNPITQRSTKFKRTLTNIDTTANTVSFYIAQSMTAEVGTTQCEIALYSTGSEQSMLCTANINIEVQGTGMSPQDEMASDDYQAIVSIKAEVTAMRDEVRDKTNQAIAAKSAAETAAQNAYNSALGVQKIVAGNEAYTKEEADLKYSVAPRKEAKSTTGELKLTDADVGLSYIELEGNSEQYTNTANKNLIDLEYQKLYGINENRYLNVNGVITTPASDNDWKISYYIKVKPGTVYTFTNLPISTTPCTVFYTKEKVFISAITNSNIINTNANKITTPSNCEYIRVSYKALTEDTLQLEEGETATEYVKGAVEAPSPEYPSEVKSVGDIPKDINGIEIRNIIDILDVVEVPDSEWQVTGGSIFVLPIRVEKKQINGMLLEALSFNIGISMSPTGLTDGTDGFYLKKNQINGLDFSSVATVYLFVYTGTVEYQLSDIKEMLKNSVTKIMVTYASEIDEYRPYIGYNDGLVKLESIGVNHADPKQVLTTRYSEVKVNEDNSVIKATQTIIEGGGSSYIYFNYEKDRQYTLYCKAKFIELSGTGGRSFVGIRDKTGIKSAIIQQGINANNVINEVLLNFTATEDGLGVMLYIQPDVNTSRRELYVYDLMIVEGEKTLQEMKALKYQPYQQQITWIPLREPLRKIANSGRYLDSLDKDGNVTQTIAKKILNKSGVGYNGEALSGKGVQGVISLGTSNVKFDVETQYSYQALSNVFKTSYGNIINYQVLYRSSVGANVSVAFIVDKNILSFNNKEGLLNYLMTLPDIAEYFVLDTPVTYQIPAVYIETHDQETNVRCLNKVKPSSMGLDYKIAINSLIKRLEALETTAVTEVNKNV